MALDLYKLNKQFDECLKKFSKKDFEKWLKREAKRLKPQTMKLSITQKETLLILRRYPNDLVMCDGWLTGGHGVKLNLKTVRALKDKGLINSWGEDRDRISELGKSIEL